MSQTNASTLTLPQALQLAVQHHQAGDLQQALTIYQKILQVEPNHSDALHLSGLVAYQSKNYHEALELIQKAIHVNAAEANFHNSLGSVLQKLGDLEKSAECFQKALTLQPQEARFHYNLGVVLKLQGATAPALVSFQQALTLNPNYAEALNGLAHLLREQGQFTKAIEYLQQALNLQPRFAEAHNNLGMVFFEQDKLEEATRCYQLAISINPNFAEFHNNLGNVLKQQGKLTEAMNCYQHALMLSPQLPELHYNLGSVWLTKNQWSQAIACFQQALDLNPNYAEAYNNLGIAFWNQSKLSEAIASYQHALVLRPQWAQAYNNLANALKDRGLIHEAIAAYQKALEIAPTDVIIHSNFLYALNFSTNYDAAAIFAAHQQFGQRHAASASQRHLNDTQISRRLKIGYLSADFRRHPVAYFIEPILANHHSQQFEIYCYYNSLQFDEITHRLQQKVAHFRSCVQLSDEALAEQIRQDQIDILVDLSGHIADHRILVLASKPAPIQVTYLGYPNTTGLTAIDYHLTDSYIDPEGLTESFHSEVPVRLPGSYYCYRPPLESPVVNELPALRNGYVTFGSLNSYAKLNPETLARWAEILRALPNSKLVMMTQSLEDSLTRQALEQHFKSLGISSSRLQLGSTPSPEETLKVYHQIDIALDTYPFNGATTTCEALWMGVPVVTLVGQTHVARVGLSLLATVGLLELITRTPQEYVSTCLKLAKNLTALQELRANLRSQMQSSLLMDAPVFTRQLETIYRRMWINWCLHQKGQQGG